MGAANPVAEFLNENTFPGLILVLAEQAELEAEPDGSDDLVFSC